MGYVAGALGDKLRRLFNLTGGMNLKIGDHITPVCDINEVSKDVGYYSAVVAVGATGWIYFYNNDPNGRTIRLRTLRFLRQSGTFTFSAIGVGVPSFGLVQFRWITPASADFAEMLTQDIVLPSGYGIGVYIDSYSGAGNLLFQSNVFEGVIV